MEIHGGGHKGIVKFYDKSKGYGFIIDNEEKNNKGEYVQYYFHFTGTLDKVVKDDLVDFEIETGQRGPKAVKVKRLKTK